VDEMNTIYIMILAISAVLFLAGCTTDITGTQTMNDQENDMTTDQNGYMDVSPKQAKELIDTKPELTVIDVSPAYDNGHIPGAVNYYVGDGSLDRAIPNLDPEAEYLIYCHTDSASILGAQKLVDAGFTSVYRLEGNYGAWVDAGYPTE
jgi:rhodanese-related sulfurtransferase